MKHVTNGLSATKRFLSELRRRKVIKVAGVYAIVAWLVIQIATQTFPVLHLPDWSATFVVVVTILGFPIAIVLAWALELTPAGVRVQAHAPAAPATPRGSHFSRWLSRAAAASQLLPPKSASGIRRDDDSSAEDPNSAKRAEIAQLRHDLRTPLNGVIGYGDLLVMQAEQLGIGPLVPDIQRLHVTATNVVEQIDRLLPPAREIAEIDINNLRARLREQLLQPAQELVQESQDLLLKAGNSDGALTDLTRQLGAARKLLSLIQELGTSCHPAAEGSMHAGFERVFSRVGRRSGSARATADAGTLLIVDDNAMNRDLLARQLVHEGYSVFTAASGTEALEKLRLHDFDLVLLDVIMPEMDGLQVLEHVQRDAKLAEVPIVMISASLNEMDAVGRCIEKGAVDYFSKPFDPVLLRARISATLHIRRLRQGLRRAQEELVDSSAAIDELIRSFVPGPLSEALKRGERSACAHYPEITAVVVRLEGVDALASRCGPSDAIARTSEMLGILDRCSSQRELEIVRVADDTYTAVVGAPEWRDDHAHLAAEYAMDVVRVVQERSERSDRLEVKIGVNTGALVAGVAGEGRLVFGLWGDAVRIAEAIAHQAPVGTIYISAATHAKLEGTHEFGQPLVVEVPGKGLLRTYPLPMTHDLS